MTPQARHRMTFPEYRAELEYLLRTLEELAHHPDERISDLAHKAHHIRESRPRGA